MQFIKAKTSRKPCFQFPNCHVTDNWDDTYRWYVGSPLVVTQKNGKRSALESEFETLWLHRIRWDGRSTLDANL